MDMNLIRGRSSSNIPKHKKVIFIDSCRLICLVLADKRAKSAAGGKDKKIAAAKPERGKVR